MNTENGSERTGGARLRMICHSTVCSKFLEFCLNSQNISGKPYLKLEFDPNSEERSGVS